MEDEKKRNNSVRRIQRWFKSQIRLNHIRSTMTMRKKALKDLMERVRSMKRSEDDKDAFRIAGMFSTSERYRTFVKQFLGTIPTNRELRSIRPKRLRSVNTFVTGVVLATTKTTNEKTKNTIDAARRMMKSLERLVKISNEKTPLCVLKYRISSFNTNRMRYMNEFHAWRKDYIEQFLEEIKPMYTQLLLLRSSKDPSGAIKRLDMLLDNLTRVVGREEARQFDLERRREAAGKLALLLGETTAEENVVAQNVRIGSSVILKRLGRGVVRFLGETEFGTGGGVWAGVELRLPVGRNNGSVRGKTYFSCPEGHGVFVRPKTLLQDKDESEKKEELEEEEDDEVIEADDEGDDEKIVSKAAATSAKRRKSSSSTKRIPSPWTVIPPPTSSDSVSNRNSNNNSTTTERPAWLSSGMSSAGGLSSDGRGGMSSDGGAETSAQANRRRRQSMARQLATLVSQRVRT